MFQKTAWLQVKHKEDNYLGRYTWDELEEERAKFTIRESIADNLWHKYHYKILWREIQRCSKTFSKPCVQESIILCGKACYAGWQAREFQLLSTHKSKSKAALEIKSDKWKRMQLIWNEQSILIQENRVTSGCSGHWQQWHQTQKDIMKKNNRMEKERIGFNGMKLENILRSTLVIPATGSPFQEAICSDCPSDPSVTSHFSCQLSLQIYRKLQLTLNLNYRVCE